MASGPTPRVQPDHIPLHQSLPGTHHSLAQTPPVAPHCLAPAQIQLSSLLSPHRTPCQLPTLQLALVSAPRLPSPTRESPLLTPALSQHGFYACLRAP